MEAQGGITIVILLCAAALVLSLAQNETKVGHSKSPELEIRASPILDLYFYVRWLSSEPSATAPDGAGFKEAVDAASSLQQQLGSALAWGWLEGLFADCTTAKELREACGRARETIELRSGKTVELRKGAVRLAEAIERVEPLFMEKTWPAHQAEIEHAEREVAEGFRSKAAECLAYVIDRMKFNDPEAPLRIRLVDVLPAPGAITQRDDDDRGVSFVAVHGAGGTQLFETILHEATHTLDVATPQGSVLDDLRARLEKAGFTRQDREWRDVPHTLMFVQAGETIRRIVDPKHEHYGVVAGYYPKVKMVADVERPIWIAYLDGKMTRAEALEKIVTEVAASKRPR